MANSTIASRRARGVRSDINAEVLAQHVERQRVDFETVRLRLDMIDSLVEDARALVHVASEALFNESGLKLLSIRRTLETAHSRLEEVQLDFETVLAPEGVEAQS
jgi:hypothetical protein